MQYRRAHAPGGTFFFTVNLDDRASDLLTSHVDALRRTFQRVRESHPFEIDAIVILPDHLHAVWTLPPGDSDFARRWSLIKAGFSRSVRKSEARGKSRRQKRERGIWQRRYWEHRIRDDADLAHHIDYIHFNPVKHGHVPRAADWPYSSIHRFIRQGEIDESWAADIDEGRTYGELVVRP